MGRDVDLGPGGRAVRKLRVIQVVGTRPQLVKAGAMSRAMAERDASDPGVTIEAMLVDTGQHYDRNMSGIFLEQLGIPEPDVRLGVGSGSHATQTGQMMIGLEPIFMDAKDAIVLVAGDTNSTLAAALAAAKVGLPVAHVEAGLRSFNRAMAEEINRVVVDHLADLLFCPSERAAENLVAEGITEGVDVTGDVMLDTVNMTLAMPVDWDGLAARLGLPEEFAVATVHRAENTDDIGRLASILEGLGAIGARLPVFLPIHPRTRPHVDSIGIPRGVSVIDPLGPREMLALVSRARLGLTDSGGLQKELYWLGVPCVTMRDETEWVETVEAGWNEVTGADATRIVAAAHRFLEAVPETRPQLYGDGRASERIVDILIDKYGVRP